MAIAPPRAWLAVSSYQPHLNPSPWIVTSRFSLIHRRLRVLGEAGATLSPISKRRLRAYAFVAGRSRSAVQDHISFGRHRAGTFTWPLVCITLRLCCFLLVVFAVFPYLRLRQSDIIQLPWLANSPPRHPGTWFTCDSTPVLLSLWPAIEPSEPDPCDFTNYRLWRRSADASAGLVRAFVSNASCLDYFRIIQPPQCFPLGPAPTVSGHLSSTSFDPETYQVFVRPLHNPGRQQATQSLLYRRKPAE